MRIGLSPRPRCYDMANRPLTHVQIEIAPFPIHFLDAAIVSMEVAMAGEAYVLERIVRVLVDHGVTADTAGLALRILRTVRAGDDIGNGLRAIPIEALEELVEFLSRNAQTPG